MERKTTTTKNQRKRGATMSIDELFEKHLENHLENWFFSLKKVQR